MLFATRKSASKRERFASSLSENEWQRFDYWSLAVTIFEIMFGGLPIQIEAIRKGKQRKFADPEVEALLENVGKVGVKAKKEFVADMMAGKRVTESVVGASSSSVSSVKKGPITFDNLKQFLTALMVNDKDFGDVEKMLQEQEIFDYGYYPVGEDLF